jgi:hypothetical protein
MTIRSQAAAPRSLRDRFSIGLPHDVNARVIAGHANLKRLAFGALRCATRSSE